MDDTRQFSWWAAKGVNPESYMINEPTRDAVIAAARADWGKLATITIVEATQDGPWNVHPFDDGLIEQLIESFEEDNGERFGEDGSEISPDGLQAAMNTAFAAYIAENEGDLRTWGFTEERNKEVLTPIDRAAVVVDNDGKPYPIVVLEDGTRIDRAFYPHSIDQGRRNPVPADHLERQ